MNGPRPRFVRARRAAEKAARREALLAAAAELLDRHDVADVSLNALAEAAGISKPNVYRYFESREEILLRLFVADLEGFAEEIERQFASPRTDRRVEQVFVDAYVARPRLCRFMAVVASVLEQNVSEAVILDLKRSVLSAAERVATALHGVKPTLTHAQCLWLNNTIGLLVAGLWPPSHPAGAVAAVVAQREFSALRPNFRRDLSTAIRVLLAGLEHG